MKRYLTSGIILIVTVLTIGVFYGKMGSSASNFPRFAFKTIEGNPEELNSLIINGELINNTHTYYPQITIENNKTIYASEKPYLEKMMGRSDADYARQKKEYRSFMRGKEYLSPYYEDKDYLAFTEEKNESGQSSRAFKPSLKVSLLQKKDKEETEFEVSVPDGQHIMNIGIQDLQMAHSKLQVLTQIELDTKSDETTTELHLYTVDIGQKKIIKDESLLSVTPKGKEVATFSYPERAEKGHSNNIFLFELSKGKQNDEGEYIEGSIKSSLYVYDYDTGELEEIKWPKSEQMQLGNVDGYYDDSRYYIIDHSEKGMNFKTFSFKTKKVTDDEVLPLDEGQVGNVNVKNGKQYIMISKVNDERPEYVPAELVIKDLKTNETLYKGETTAKFDDKEDAKKYGLQLQWIDVTE